ncbi:MAG: hypothetical protein L3J69_15375 [Desulfobacula sp.]|nr:hypothetical protein [Desulfobacula sp.]
MDACITGIGWVLKDSMGYPRSEKKFPERGLPLIKRKDVIDYPYKPFGRMDNFSKLGFAAISFALADAGIKTEIKTRSVKENISLVASTATGCLETDIRYRKTLTDNVPSPAIFAYTLDSCFLGEAGIYFGLTGESFMINEQNTAGLTGLYFGLEMIHSGDSETVLCGVCNSDIQLCQSSASNIIPGSLFFVIEKESEHSYTQLKAISPESIYDENKVKITDLYDLAKRLQGSSI